MFTKHEKKDRQSQTKTSRWLIIENLCLLFLKKLIVDSFCMENWGVLFNNEMSRLHDEFE